MHLYSSDDYLTGLIYYHEYDPVMITTCIDLMTPTKGCIMQTANSFSKFIKYMSLPCNIVDGYKCAEIPEDWIEHWKTIEPMLDLKFPPVNAFWTDNFTLIDSPKVLLEHPVKVYSGNLCELWYKFDAKFRLPKCYINLCYVSALPSKSIKNTVMLDLYVDVLKHLINGELYAATLAGLAYEIEISKKGLVVKVNGFNDKLPLLTQMIAKYIPQCWNLMTKSLFDDMKEKRLEILYMQLYNSAKLSEDIIMSIVVVGHWTVCDRHATLESLEFDEFKNFLQHYVDHVYVECLVQGNISEIEAIENIRKCVKISKCGAPLKNEMPVLLNINEIPCGKRCCKVKNYYMEYVGTAVTNYYQFDNPSITLSVMIDLLIMIWNDYRFSELYKYRKGPLFMPRKGPSGTIGYTLQIQDYTSLANSEKSIISSEKTIDDQRNFINKLSKDLSDDELQCIKEIMLDEKSKTDDKLCDEVKRNWREMSTGEFLFDRQAREYDVISELKIEDFRKWMSTLTDDGFAVRKLSAQVVAGKEVQKDLSNAKVQQNNANTTTAIDSTKTPRFQLKYLLGEFPKPKEALTYYYITDIQKYKSELKILTINGNVTAK